MHYVVGLVKEFMDPKYMWTKFLEFQVSEASLKIKSKKKTLVSKANRKFRKKRSF